MRRVILTAGIIASVAGLAVSAYEVTTWLQFGDWPSIEFGTVWIALGGISPGLLRSYDVGGILTTLFEMPLGAALLLGVLTIAWMAREQVNDAHTLP